MGALLFIPHGGLWSAYIPFHWVVGTFQCTGFKRASVVALSFPTKFGLERPTLEGQFLPTRIPFVGGYWIWASFCNAFYGNRVFQRLSICRIHICLYIGSQHCFRGNRNYYARKYQNPGKSEQNSVLYEKNGWNKLVYQKVIRFQAKDGKSFN